MTNTQLYLLLGFNIFLIGIMWNQLSSDIREMRADIKLLTDKVCKLMAKVDK